MRPARTLSTSLVEISFPRRRLGCWRFCGFLGKYRMLIYAAYKHNDSSGRLNTYTQDGICRGWSRGTSPSLDLTFPPTGLSENLGGMERGGEGKGKGKGGGDHLPYFPPLASASKTTLRTRLRFRADPFEVQWRIRRIDVLLV